MAIGFEEKITGWPECSFVLKVSGMLFQDSGFCLFDLVFRFSVARKLAAIVRKTAFSAYKHGSQALSDGEHQWDWLWFLQ